MAEALIDLAGIMLPDSSIDGCEIGGSAEA